MLHKLCCKSMYQAEYGLKRPPALSRGLGRRVLFTMINWEFRPSRLSTVFKSIRLMTSCKMSTPLIHKKKTFEIQHISVLCIANLFATPLYKEIRLSIPLFHFMWTWEQTFSSFPLSMKCNSGLALVVNFRNCKKNLRQINGSRNLLANPTLKS